MINRAMKLKFRATTFLLNYDWGKHETINDQRMLYVTKFELMKYTYRKYGSDSTR